MLGSAAGASLLTEGCRDPRIYKEEVWGQYAGSGYRVYPYVNQPDGFEDGVPQYYATACAMCPAGCGLFVRTLGGRAIEAQGNPEHPVSLGKSCSRGQASVQHLYNPDRLRYPVARVGRGGAKPAVDPEGWAGRVGSDGIYRTGEFSQVDWSAAMERVRAGIAGGGAGAILVDGTTIGRSPSLMKLIGEFAGAHNATVASYDLLDDAPWRAAAQAVYGRNQVPAYRIDQADCIVAFNSNFLEAWPSPVLYGAQFGEFRQGPRRAQGGHGRFYFVGPRMSMTAAKADRWIPCNPGTEGVVAAALLDLVQAPAGAAAPTSLAQAAQTSGVSTADMQQMAGWMKAAGDRALAVAGDGLMSQPNATQTVTAVESINAATKSQCVGFGEAALPMPAPGRSSLADLAGIAQRMNSGAIRWLLIIGQANPMYSLPRAYGFAETLERVPFIASMTPFADETSAMADVVLPTRSFMESWHDNVPLVIPAGERVATLRQPTIDPFYLRVHNQNNVVSDMPWMDTRETADVLIALSGLLGGNLANMGTDSHDVTRRQWGTIGQSNPAQASIDNDTAWVAALGKGGVWENGGGTTVASATGRVVAATAAAPAQAAEGEFALHLFPHIQWTDGRNSNNNWAQEIPDPMSMAIWNSWAEINLQTAEKMGIRTGDIIKLTSANGYLLTPALPSPGLHPGTIAMPIGNGHAPGVYGRNPRGHNPLVILNPASDSATGALAYNATYVKVEKVRDAVAGYHPEQDTLILMQDRPGGAEPDAVKDLIHMTAKEWRAANPVKGQAQVQQQMQGHPKGISDTGG